MDVSTNRNGEGGETNGNQGSVGGAWVVMRNRYGVFRRSAVNPIPHPFFINSKSSLTAFFNRLGKEGDGFDSSSSLEYHYYIIPQAFGMAIPFPKRRVWNNRTMEATQRLSREFDNVYCVC